MKRRVTGGHVATVAVLAFLAVTPLGDAAGRFSDDDGNVHEDNIETLASLGITQGCNPPINDRFCPDDSVTRGQMAAFLRRALDLPPAPGDSFVDDDDTIFEDDIEALSEAGITRGCNPPANDHFCPHHAITRAQMAAFLVRGFRLSGGDRDVFGDDDRSLFEADIDRLASSGVTFGCNPPDNDRYCPDDAVRRDQMASFLVRALEEFPVPPPPQPSFTFTAGGDIGADEDTDATLEAMGPHRGDFFLALGDLSYSDVEPEAAWCDYMQRHLGSGFPIQLLAGNHEDDGRDDGFIREFAACLPDRMGSAGDYGVEYYFDVGDLARIILIAAGDTVDGVDYDYEEGSERMAWLDAAIEGADDKEWVIVGTHRVCLSAGRKDCEVEPDLMHRLLAGDVDLVLQAHDHTYQRSKQLRCAEVGSYRASCVTDDGSDGAYPAGEGTVFVVTGLMGGGVPYDIHPDDPEYPYFAETLGAGDSHEGYGYSLLEVSQDAIEVEFVGTTTGYTDAFSIRGPG